MPKSQTDHFTGYSSLFHIKAATGNFHFVLILAAPVDKSRMSSTTSCREDLDLVFLLILFFYYFSIFFLFFFKCIKLLKEKILSGKYILQNFTWKNLNISEKMIYDTRPLLVFRVLNN